MSIKITTQFEMQQWVENLQRAVVLDNLKLLDSDMLLVISGLIGSHLCYPEVQKVVKDLKNSISLPAVQTEVAFIENALKYLPTEQEKNRYLARHIIKIVSDPQSDRTLLSHPLLSARFPRLSLTDLSQMLISAADEGYLEVVQELVENDAIPHDEKKWALVKPSQTGRLEIVQAFFQSSNPVDPIFLRTALVNAAGNHQSEIVQALLQYSIPLDIWEGSIDNTIYSNCHGTFQILIKYAINYPITDTFKKHLDNLLLTTCKQKATIFAQELLLNDKLPTFDNSVIQKGMELANRNPDIMKLLESYKTTNP